MNEQNKNVQFSQIPHLPSNCGTEKKKESQNTITIAQRCILGVATDGGTLDPPAALIIAIDVIMDSVATRCVHGGLPDVDEGAVPTYVRHLGADAGGTGTQSSSFCNKNNVGSTKWRLFYTFNWTHFIEEEVRVVGCHCEHFCNLNMMLILRGGLFHHLFCTGFNRRRDRSDVDIRNFTRVNFLK